MRYAFILASAACFWPQAPVVSAQEDVEPEPIEKASGPPIVVTAEPDEREVIVGSRIARRPVFVDGPIATSTGTPGLVPQSGMDPTAGPTVIRKRSAFVASREGIGKEAARLLFKAQNRAQDGDIDTSYGILASIADPTAFSVGEARAALERMYVLGSEAQRDDIREYALHGLVETGLPSEEEASARRTLAALAMKAKDNDAAIDQLRSLADADLARAQDLANLAVLMRGKGSVGGEDYMRRALALRRSEGHEPPTSWQGFLAD